MPDGKPHRDWYTAEGLLAFLTHHTDRQARRPSPRRAHRP